MVHRNEHLPSGGSPGSPGCLARPGPRPRPYRRELQPTPGKSIHPTTMCHSRFTVYVCTGQPVHKRPRWISGKSACARGCCCGCQRNAALKGLSGHTCVPRFLGASIKGSAGRFPCARCEAKVWMPHLKQGPTILYLPGRAGSCLHTSMRVPDSPSSLPVKCHPSEKQVEEVRL